MGLQSCFLKFNSNIKMDYEENSELADKRDKLLNKIRGCKDIPSFKELGQGSYSMYTGVEPIDKEYDIDVALRFSVNKSDYEPLKLKEALYDLLDSHTDYGAEIKNPCVTVTYKKDGEAAFHADLVVYVYEDKDDTDSQMYLARGKASKPKEIRWEKSDPKGLVEYINNAVSAGEDREQYRRVIRYLKRWKNRKFSSAGNAEPPSIGITLIAANKFKPVSKYDLLEEKYKYDDLQAVYNFAKEIQSLFDYKKTSDNGRMLYRIYLPLPSELKFENNTDVFEKMTDAYMTDFKDKIDRLVEDLEDVIEEADEVEQCNKLNKIFGDDFEVPETKNVAKIQKDCIPSSSASGVK